MKLAIIARSALMLPLGLIASCDLLGIGSADPATAPRGGYRPRWSLSQNLERLRLGDLEQCYASAIDLEAYSAPQARRALEALRERPEAMLRNAAARALADSGDEQAVAILIDNLHQDRAAHIAADAIYHLRAIFGTDLGYDPRLGYRHRSEKQAEWREWWEARYAGAGEQPPALSGPGASEARTLGDRILASVRAQIASFSVERSSREEHRERVAALVSALAPIAESRDPQHLEILEQTLAFLTTQCPERPDLWSRYARAALNNGHPERAMRLYRRALKLTPREAWLHDELGAVLAGLGFGDAAEEAFRRALHLDPLDGEAAANLADVLAAGARLSDPGEQDEDLEAAIQAYRVAERLAPGKWYRHRLWRRRLEEDHGRP